MNNGQNNLEGSSSVQLQCQCKLRVCLRAVARHNPQGHNRAGPRIVNSLIHAIEKSSYRIRLQCTCLPQYSHCRFKVRFEGGPDCQGNIPEAAENGYLNIPIQYVTLKVFKEHSHKGSSVLCWLVPKSARDIADKTNSNRTQLRIFVLLQGGIEVMKEGLDIRRKIYFQS